MYVVHAPFSTSRHETFEVALAAYTNLSRVYPAAVSIYFQGV